MDCYKSTEELFKRRQCEHMNETLRQFDRAEERLKAKKAAIEDMQNEYQLLLEQALSSYRSITWYDDLVICAEQAQKWASMLRSGEKIDKRRRYTSKDMFQCLEQRLSDYLGVEIHITDIIARDYSEVWIVEFDCLGHSWKIEIPNCLEVSEKSYSYYGPYCFKLALGHRDSEYSSTIFASTFYEEELKQLMQHGIEQFCSKEG